MIRESRGGSCPPPDFWPKPQLNLYNFSPGPALLPGAVYARIRDDWDDRGGRVPLLEIGHRGDEFSQIAERAEQTLRRLLEIPSHYAVLFLPGGARAQYAMVPLNLARGARPFDYLDTGHWSRCAIAEARRYGRVNVVARLGEGDGLELPPPADWRFSERAAYCHLVDNETLTGFELPADHVATGCPLVADMTSNFLTRPFDVGRFGVVYAGAQKNAGIAGVTLVVVREDLLGAELPFTPTLYSYAVHAQAGSRYNTPPVFAWYVCGLMLAWIELEGGVGEMYRRSLARAEHLYACIDAAEIYANPVARRYRSRVNVHFRIKPAALERDFLERAEREGLFGLRGHRAVGGIRASLYNGMPAAGVRALADFMRAYAAAR